MSDPQAPLKDFQPKHEFFVGIDSDGCVFDTMEIKHKECFIPNIIKYWNLQAVSKYAREAGEFVNLYSQVAGHQPLARAADGLRSAGGAAPRSQRRGVRLPDVPTLRDWAKTEKKLGNPALKAAVEKTGDPVLKQALAWSEAVNASIADIVHDVPPFPFVRESLEALGNVADMMVRLPDAGRGAARGNGKSTTSPSTPPSSRPGDGQQDRAPEARRRAASMPKDHVLMIGDAPGDFKAAQANGFLFFPVNPGSEDKSWQRFYEEAMARSSRAPTPATTRAKLIAEFEALLPDVPPWKR